MASPQVENGYTRIANELLEALITADLNGTQFRIMLAVIRESYGRQSKTVSLSYTKIAEMLDQPRTVVGRNLKQLVARNFLRHSGGELSTWSVQKDYSQWLGSDHLVTSHCLVTSDQMVPKTSDQTVTRGSDQMVTQLKKDERKKESGGVERTKDAAAAVLNSAGKTAQDQHDLINALKSVGMTAEQRRKIIAAQPEITVADVDAWVPFLQTPPPWCTTPEGFVYTGLLKGDAPPVERAKTNGGGGRPITATSIAPDVDIHEARRRSAEWKAAHPEVFEGVPEWA